jgi:hypothetical protein
MDIDGLTLGQMREIETDSVPIPARKGLRRGVRDSLRALSQGPLNGSMFFPGAVGKNLSASAAMVAPGKWATVRTVEDGVRVWKTAEPSSITNP